MQAAAAATAEIGLVASTGVIAVAYGEKSLLLMATVYTFIDLMALQWGFGAVWLLLAYAGYFREHLGGLVESARNLNNILASKDYEDRVAELLDSRSDLCRQVSCDFFARGPEGDACTVYEATPAIRYHRRAFLGTAMAMFAILACIAGVTPLHERERTYLLDGWMVAMFSLLSFRGLLAIDLVVIRFRRLYAFYAGEFPEEMRTIIGAIALRDGPGPEQSTKEYLRYYEKFFCNKRSFAAEFDDGS